MTATIGITGLVSVPDEDGDSASQTGLDLYHLIETGSGPYSFTMQVPQDVFDATEFGATSVANAAGLKAWTANISARFPKAGAKIGSGGLVTFASGYAAGVRDWSLTLNAAEHDVTAFDSTTPPEWRAWLPGLVSWSGSYNAHIDGTTPLVVPGASAAATFKLTEDGTTDRTLAGNIVVNSMAPTVAVGEKNVVAYGFAGNGDLTAAGTGNILPSGAIGTPDECEVVFKANSSRTYTGRAFWTSIGITVPVDGLIEVTATLRGTGALTVA